jgi:hypothetical protein
MHLPRAVAEYTLLRKKCNEKDMRQDDLSALHDFKHLYNWYEHFGE